MEISKDALRQEINKFASRSLVLTAQGLGLAWIVGFIMFCVLYPYQQIVGWLKTGIFPPRDLYWSFADVSCAATGWKAQGFTGMDVCRVDHIEFTDWVGVNRIFNWVFDIHTGILFLVASSAIYFLVIAILEDLATKKSN